MALLHLHQDIVGNMDSHAILTGWTFPLPEDDAWSCDGTEESNRETQFEMDTSFEEEPIDYAAPTPTRCPAHFGSTGGGNNCHL